MINRSLDYKGSNRLIPTIIQEVKTGKVLMLGYMNKEALDRTQKEGTVYFWSRSKKRLWEKGETSGNFLQVKKIYTDCDNDSLLVQVRLAGKYICHNKRRSCYYKLMTNTGDRLYLS